MYKEGSYDERQIKTLAYRFQPCLQNSQSNCNISIVSCKVKQGRARHWWAICDIVRGTLSKKG